MATTHDTALRHVIADKAPNNRRLLEDVLADEQAYAEELQGWLTE